MRKTSTQHLRTFAVASTSNLAFDFFGLLGSSTSAGGNVSARIEGSSITATELSVNKGEEGSICRCSQSGRTIGFFLKVTGSSSSTVPPAIPNDRRAVFLGPMSVSDGVGIQDTATYFLAPFLRAASSRSFWAASRAFCWARFSAAVIRGTMSSNGFSMILTVLIFGGLNGGFSR